MTQNKHSHEVQMMKEMYERGGLNRREFMQGLLASGLTVTAAGVLVSTSFDAHAQTPQKGGKITFAWDQHGPADTNDPALFTATIDYTRGRAHYNNLLQFNDDLSLRAELAEEYDVNATATEFTFKLRKDVTWHDEGTGANGQFEVVTSGPVLDDLEVESAENGRQVRIRR